MKPIYSIKDFSDPDFHKSIKDVDRKKGVVTGYYAAFHNKDLGGDIIRPGAFARTISARGPQGANRIMFLSQHDSRENLGKPYVLQEDKYGLYHESKISKTTLGNDTLILLEDGVLDSFSIGYRTMDEERDGDANILKELYLYEGSLVTFPMNEAARATGLKSALGFDDADAVLARIKKLEKYCRSTTASDDTIELLLLNIKQLQQLLIEKSTGSAEDATRPDDEKLMLEQVQQMNQIEIIKSFLN